tara:strand:+ start:211 stop:534 length:324 start_codon:yes stop_codon:yes gene_type:complete
MNEERKVEVESNDDPALLLVSGSTGDKAKDREYVKRLSNAILEVYSKHEVVRLRSVGAASINNATKAYIIARSHMEKDGIRLISEDSFTTVELHGEKTAIIKELKAI